MKTKYFFVISSLLMGVALIAGLSLPESGYGQECRIVRILDEGAESGRLNIEPESMWIPKGTCVIWVNWTNGYEVNVSFAEGKRCEDITESPVGFTISAQNCYVASAIPVGGTSSLRFMEAGQYEYEISGKERVAQKGKIFVR